MWRPARLRRRRGTRTTLSWRLSFRCTRCVTPNVASQVGNRNGQVRVTGPWLPLGLTNWSPVSTEASISGSRAGCARTSSRGGGYAPVTAWHLYFASFGLGLWLSWLRNRRGRLLAPGSPMVSSGNLRASDDQSDVQEESVRAQSVERRRSNMTHVRANMRKPHVRQCELRWPG